MANQPQPSQPPSRYTPREDTSAVIRFDKDGVVLSERAKNVLGFIYDEGERKSVAIMAVATGMPLDALAKESNIKTLATAWKSVRERGMVPGRHFYLVPHKDRNSDVADFVYIESAQYLQSNVDNFCLLESRNTKRIITYRLDVRPVRDQVEANELLVYFGPKGAIPSPDNRIVQARYVRVVDGVAELKPGEGWEMCTSVGIYLHEGTEGGKRSGEKGSYNIASDQKLVSGNVANRNPLQVAEGRALRMAAKRFVNQNFLPVDSRSTQERIEQLNELVREQKYEIRQDAGLLEMGDEFERSDDIDPRGFEVPKAVRIEDDGDVLWATADKKAAPKAASKMVTVMPEPLTAPEIEGAEDAEGDEEAVDPEVVDIEQLLDTVYGKLSEAAQNACFEIKKAGNADETVANAATRTKIEEWLATMANGVVGDMVCGERLVGLLWRTVAGRDEMRKESAGAFLKATGNKTGNKWELLEKSELRSAVVEAKEWLLLECEEEF